MNMERLSLILVLALSGCSALVNSALEDNDGGVNGDAGPDTGEPTDCRRMPDGTVCGDSQICINNLCESSRCGDGIVAEGEECDELDDVSGDGCEPGSCVFTCSAPEDCDDGDLCTIGTCTANVCETTNASNETTCTPPSGATGTCSDGLCVGEGCGNGVIDDGEACDDETAGCIACQFACEVDEECADVSFCNGEETCDVSTHVCVAGATLTCDDMDECTLDSCSDSISVCINTLIDEDGDGFASDMLTCTDPDQGGDCRPNDMAFNPRAAELCDGEDNDCDGEVDETDAVLCYPDDDEDGFGRGTGVTRNCECMPGEVTVGGDCNDTTRSARPTQMDYFPEPHCTRDSSCFDYNCNGDVEPQVVTLGVCEAISGVACGGTRGWAATRPPGCGVAGAWISGCTGIPRAGCTAVMTTQTQQCR